MKKSSGISSSKVEKIRRFSVIHGGSIDNPAFVNKLGNSDKSMQETEYSGRATLKIKPKNGDDLAEITEHLHSEFDARSPKQDNKYSTFQNK